MLDNLTLTKERIFLCEHCTITEGEERIAYYLYSITTSSGKEYYAIELSGDASAELVIVGDEIEVARDMYLRVISGRVSTITLGDIIHDMKMSKIY